ncbi:hypothetical protein DESC_180089 [Desulfosarcina cetonica]|nr:hypothetical protein DESC_180089 [Desulfosarcina cetonica]
MPTMTRRSMKSETVIPSARVGEGIYSKMIDDPLRWKAVFVSEPEPYFPGDKDFSGKIYSKNIAFLSIPRIMAYGQGNRVHR